jgi:hypothetical protein
MKLTGGNYPAPLKILDVVKAGAEVLQCGVSCLLLVTCRRFCLILLLFVLGLGGLGVDVAASYAVGQVWSPDRRRYIYYP